ncbi:MAG: ethanolamine ammonia-lyase reactivating factor EutA [Oscillospiraceae bacterium]|nr:ethanolamine ammonia-lyase reactivating factor EutA [Oscillospiraceae bacterium]
MTDETLLSVGIDLGTSTTQLVFSRLHVKNRAAAFTIPQMEIAEKEILYKSDIHFTPLLDDSTIHGSGVREIVAEEYRKAGISLADVDTGAVIITGETARKENAEAVLAELSSFAGDFVVATAGPHLESILAGKGSGAEEYSREHRCTLLHFDIGGGTTNMVLYQNGEIYSTGCLNIGGRLVKVNDGVIVYISPVLDGLTDLQVGQKVTEAELLPLCKTLVNALEDMVIGAGETIPLSLRTTALMKLPEKIDVLSFSGGVADFIYTDSQEDAFRYGDIGVLLGRTIAKSRLYSAKTIRPTETIRATVVGAGSHSTQLSGSTISYDGVEFPLKNLPVLALSEEEQSHLSDAIRKKRAWFSSPPAIFFPGWKNPSFEQISHVAEEILASAGDMSPLVIAVGADMGKALGQALVARGQKGLVCVDSLSMGSGAYLDIGPPVAGGAVLPVVIKTLIFEK